MEQKGQKEPSLHKQIEFYKKRVEELTSANLKYDISVSGLKHELRQKRKAFSLISELQKTIGVQMDVSSIFNVTIHAINPTLGMDKTVMLVPTEKQHVYRPGDWSGFRQEDVEDLAKLTITFPEAFTDGSGLLVVNRSTESTPLIEEIRSAFNLPFFICLPVIVENTPIGLILSGRHMEAKPFYPPLEQRDVDTFQAIADLITATIRNRRLTVLKEMDRLKTEFFANVSHEFRTPITLTLGPLEQILKGRYGEIPDKIQNQLRVIERNQEHLLSLVNQILDLAKLEAGTMRLKVSLITDMNRFVESRISQFRPLAQERGIELRVSLDSGIREANLYIDREQFDKILYNLLSNALKFTKQGHIEISTTIKEDSFYLEVSDTGIGIKQDQLAHIFDRFRQADGSESREYAGTGLGLALVKEIAGLHGGDVIAQSQYGKGSRFKVSVPLGKSHLDPAWIVEVAEEELESIPGRKKVFIDHEGTADRKDVDGMNAETESEFDSEKPIVLYVEDNADLRIHVRELLKQKYNIFLAVDGRDGVLKTRKFKPDLILTDQMMPQMSGRALLREIRNDPVLSSTPVILLTAKAGAESRLESLDAGADDYLTKPFDEAELHIRIRNLLRARTQKKELAELNKKLEAQVAEQLAELDFAGRIQNELLPKTAPDLTGYEIAGRNIPAKQVGGDYFDFIPLNDHQIAICLGDVCGKGLPASLLMANLQATIRAQVMYCSTVSECLERSNKLLFHRTDKKTFISLCLGILDIKNHTLCYSNAGQNLPIVFSKNRKPVLLEKRGIVLAVKENMTYEHEVVKIKKGDLLLIYSDGINEAMNEDSEEFGEERLKGMAILYKDRSPSELIDRIVSAIEYFIRGRTASDDMTLIAIKRK